MADEFSWTDRLSAFSSCLPCLSSLPCFHSGSSPQTGPIRLPNDDAERSLRGLLSSSSSQYTTLDADALSLHSTVDSSGRRKPRSAGRARNVLRRQPKRVSVMGVALFGRPVRDDELSPNEDEHDDERVIRITPEGSGSGDAQPVRIDDALLARIANSRGGIDSQRFSHVQSKSSHTHGHLSTTSGPLSPRTTLYTDDAPNSPMDEIDEEEALAKAERKARRRERRALKQAALSLALAEDPRATFEGFQGSGSTHAAIPDYFRQSVASPLSEARSSESGTSSGRRAQPVLSVPQDEHEDVADGDADFGAQAYTARRMDGSSADGRSSDTRSRTSASRSTGAGPQHAEDTTAKPRRSKSGRSKKSSKNSSTTSSSAPLASPASAGFDRDVQIASVLDDREQQPWVRPMDHDEGSRFPSAGLGGGLRRKSSDAGALLAGRGGF